MRYLFAIMLLIFALGTSAAIFEKDDGNGHVTYTDMPTKNSKVIGIPNNFGTSAVIETPATQVVVEPKISPPVVNSPHPGFVAIAAENARKPYTTFDLVVPQDQETIQNQPLIPVELSIEPKLQKGDKIIVQLDGKLFGPPRTMEKFDLAEVERGAHQLSAALVDANGKVLKQSNSITIFVHKASVNSINRIQQRGGS